MPQQSSPSSGEKIEEEKKSPFQAYQKFMTVTTNRKSEKRKSIKMKRNKSISKEISNSEKKRKN